MISVPGQPSVIQTVAVALDAGGAAYALVGDAGLNVRGVRRAVTGVSFLVHVEALRMPAVVGELVKAGAEVDVEHMVRGMAARKLVVFPFLGVEVELLPAVLPYMHEILGNATAVAGAPLLVASLEDLIVLELISGPADVDVADVLTQAGQDLDRDYMRERVTAHVPSGDPRAEAFL